MQPGTRQMANKVPYMLIMDHNNPILPTLHSQFGRQLPKLVRLRALIHFEEIAVPATSCLNEAFRNALPARRRSGANTKAIRGVLGTLKGGGGGGCTTTYFTHAFFSVRYFLWLWSVNYRDIIMHPDHLVALRLNQNHGQHHAE